MDRLGRPSARWLLPDRPARTAGVSGLVAFWTVFLLALGAGPLAFGVPLAAAGGVLGLGIGRRVRALVAAEAPRVRAEGAPVAAGERPVAYGRRMSLRSTVGRAPRAAARGGSALVWGVRRAPAATRPRIATALASSALVAGRCRSSLGRWARAAAALARAVVAWARIAAATVVRWLRSATSRVRPLATSLRREVGDRCMQARTRLVAGRMPTAGAARARIFVAVGRVRRELLTRALAVAASGRRAMAAGGRRRLRVPVVRGDATERDTSEAASRRAIRALNQAASEHRRRGETEQAITSCEQALELLAPLDDPRGEAMTLNSLALALANAGETERAGESYERAAAILGELEERHLEAQVLANLGTLREREERAEEAEHCWREALERLEAGSPAYERIAERLK